VYFLVRFYFGLNMAVFNQVTKCYMRVKLEGLNMVSLTNYEFEYREWS